MAVPSDGHAREAASDPTVDERFQRVRPNYVGPRRSDESSMDSRQSHKLPNKRELPPPQQRICLGNGPEACDTRNTDNPDSKGGQFVTEYTVRRQRNRQVETFSLHL